MKSRVVHDQGEDHSWAEVKLGDNWVHVDPSNNYFDRPTVYENGSWKQISYAYAIYENGGWEDVTNRYTDTGKLIVHVISDGENLENAKIAIKSRFLMENKGREKPEKIVSDSKYLENNRTDENGISVFHLGGNKYDLIVTSESNNKRDEKTINLRENSITRVNFELT